MPKNCKECKYKLQHDFLCREKDLQKKIEETQIEILDEVKKSKTDYSQKPTDAEIAYWRKIQKELETKNDTYRILLKTIHIIVCLFCIIMIVASMVYAISLKEYNMLVVALPFLLFLLAAFISIYKVKEKTEQDAYNSIMALISLTSLVLAILSMTQ